MNKMANTAKIAAIIAGIIGFFYAVLPHSIHVGSSLDFGLTHTVHITIGIVLIVIAIIAFVLEKGQ